MGFLNHDLEKAVKIQAETIQKQSDDIRKLTHENQRLYRELIHCIKHCNKPTPNPVRLILTFNTNSNSQNMVELKSGQSSTGTLSLIDQVTLQPVPGATFSNVTATSADASIASIVANADGTVTATGVSAGTTSVIVNAIANFNNSLGNPDSQALTITEQVIVDAVPVPNPVALAISWSTPA